MITLENITKVYKTGDESLEVLKNISLTINQHDFIGIMGPSGSGKSSLINLLGFVDRDYQGNYLLAGEDITKFSDNRLSKVRNQNVGFVFQDFKLIEELSIEKNVSLPLIYNGEGERVALKKSREALDLVGLSEKYKKLPNQLSGGQKQRASIARAMVNNPSFLIADEPTGALDSMTSQNILETFHQLNEQGVTIIMVTHDEKMIKYCTRVFRIKDGEITSDSDLVTSGGIE